MGKTIGSRFLNTLEELIPAINPIAADSEYPSTPVICPAKNKPDSFGFEECLESLPES